MDDINYGTLATELVVTGGYASAICWALDRVVIPGASPNIQKSAIVGGAVMVGELAHKLMEGKLAGTGLEKLAAPGLSGAANFAVDRFTPYGVRAERPLNSVLRGVVADVGARYLATTYPFKEGYKELPNM